MTIVKVQLPSFLSFFAPYYIHSLTPIVTQSRLKTSGRNSANTLQDNAGRDSGTEEQSSMENFPPLDFMIPHQFEGVVRPFLLHLPISFWKYQDLQDHKSIPKVPVWMFLHGMGGTPEWAAAETGLSQFADQNDFIVVYPSGNIPFPHRPIKFLTNPPFWNDGAVREDGLTNQIDDVSYLKEVLDWLERYLSVSRFFLAGFSNGAGMSFRLVTELTNRFAAVAPVSGYYWLRSLTFAPPVPTFYLVGDRDPLVPLSGGKVRTFWGQREERIPVEQMWFEWGTAMSGYTTRKLLQEESDCHRYGFFKQSSQEITQEITQEIAEPLFEALIIHEMGHHWPGGQGGLGEKLGGPIQQRFQANELIWNFFKKHLES